MEILARLGVRFPRTSWLWWLGIVLLSLFAWRRLTVQTWPVLSPIVDAGPVGAFHVHSNDSHDGRLAPEALIAVAEQGGLDFLVLTEHNVQRTHLVPGKLHVISAAELSTPQGHAIQLGLPSLVPEPIRRSKQLHQHIRSMGGRSIVAHPTCPKRPWLGDLEQVGGLEIANTGTSFRRLGGPSLLGLWPLLLVWPFDPVLALVQLYQRDDAALALWDGVEESSVGGFCGTDTHGWIDPALNMSHWLLQLSYPQQIGTKLSHAAIVQALHQGKFHCIAGLLAPKVQFTWLARKDEEVVGGAGDTLSRSQVDVLEATMQTDVPLSLRLYRDGAEVIRTDSPLLRLSQPAVGLYRVEVWLELKRPFWGTYGAPVLYSNRIRLVGE